MPPRKVNIVAAADRQISAEFDPHNRFPGRDR
jgi:hypothetical protein